MKTKIIYEPDLVKAMDRSRGETIFLDATSKHLDELVELAKGKKYFIHTYGCQANIRDEETIRGLLESVGYVRSDKADNSDIVILNTCAVRENAEDKVYGEIGNLKKLRRANKEMVLNELMK